MVSWSYALGAWERYLRAAGQSGETIRLRRFHLERAARELGRTPDALTSAELVEWLGSKSWAPATRRSHRSTLRSFYAWAVAAGLVESSPAAELPTVRVPRGMPRPASDAAYRAALIAADARGRRALRLGAECGLRRGEIARVRGGDVVPDLEGWSLRVAGKGGHVRLVPLPDDLAEELLELGDGWAFPSPRGAGHLTPAHLGKLVSRLLPDGLTTHTLRHRAGTRAYQGTHDLRAVQEFLGHAKPETTAIYTEVGRDAIRRAQRAAA